MRVFLLLLALALTPNLLRGQDKDHLFAAQKFMQSPGQQAGLDAILSKDVIISQINAIAPNLSAKDRAAVTEIISQELDAFRPIMMTAMVKATADSFTINEINAMTDFYSTPEGTAVGTKMQPYMVKTYKIMGPELQGLQNNIRNRMKDYKTQN